MNKVISGDVNEPLSVEAIANGTSMADPRFVQSQFLQAGLRGRVSWNYGRILENLKK